MKESSKISSNTQSLIWLLVVNDKKEAPIDTIEATLKGYQALLVNYSEFKFVFTNIHNKDQLKRTHLHAFIELFNKATKKALLDTLEGLLGVDRDQLSLVPSNSAILGVQYLVHKNDPEKEQYSFSDIVGNNQEELENRFGSSYVNPEEERKKILFGSKTIGQLLEKMSIEEAKKVLPVWKAIKEEQGFNKEGLIDKFNTMSKDYCLLYDLLGKVFERVERLIDKETFKAEFGGLKGVYDDLLPF